MSKIEDVELIIRNLVEINEAIVSNYDSRLLCSDFENAKRNIKKLHDKKIGLIKTLETSLNEFFEIRQNFITRRLKVTSFALLPNVIGYELKFYIPKTVDQSSRQYFCYITMMDRLVREYDAITLQKDGYYILDITASLNIDKLFKGD